VIEIDRMALVIKPKLDFLNWLNSVVVDEPVSEEELVLDATVLLVPLIEDEQELTQYMQGSYQSIFEQELDSWCVDSRLWPEKRDFEAFMSFFSISTHTLVLDNVLSDYDVEEVTLQ
jgi:hypothetical protein